MEKIEPESRLAGYKYRSDIIVGISQVLNKWLVPDSPENGALSAGRERGWEHVAERQDRADRTNKTSFSQRYGGGIFIVL